MILSSSLVNFTEFSILLLSFQNIFQNLHKFSHHTLKFVKFVKFCNKVCLIKLKYFTGNVTEYLLYKKTGIYPLSNPAFNASSCGFYETGQSKCKYGTQNNFQVSFYGATFPKLYVLHSLLFSWGHLQYSLIGNSMLYIW